MKKYGTLELGHIIGILVWTLVALLSRGCSKLFQIFLKENVYINYWLIDRYLDSNQIKMREVHLHSESTVKFLHEMETVWSQQRNIRNSSSIPQSRHGNVIKECCQVLDRKVVSVIFRFIAQFLKYFAKISEHFF